MRITFNDESIETTATVLTALLEERQLAGKTGIAVALNECVIPQSRWAATELNERDSILVITAAAGG